MLELLYNILCPYMNVCIEFNVLSHFLKLDLCDKNNLQIN